MARKRSGTLSREPLCCQCMFMLRFIIYQLTILFIIIIMPAHCVVPMCRGKGGHKFPSDPVENKRWIHAVRRGELKWTPSKWSKVCPAHFEASDYVTVNKENEGLVNKLLKNGVVPHIFSWKCPTRSAISRRDRAQVKIQKLEKREIIETTSVCHDVGNEVEVNFDEDNSSIFEGERHELQEPRTIESSTQTEATLGFSAKRHTFNPQRFHFYTGLETYEAFRLLFHTLGEVVDELSYYYGTKPCMTSEDQFFLTLVKLRLAKSNFELSDMFEISEKEVMNIFVTWINFLYFHFKEINWWPSKDLVKFYSPTDFKAKFPTTRVIIDGTEIPILRPKQPIIQQGTFSTYKNRNTVKVLVGVTPGGLVSYVSEAYGGSTSDRQICERSNLMTMCESGDSVMADKGFNVQDLLIPSNVEINIPEFFKKKNRMSGSSVTKDRKIASKRVHVERIIGLAKTFKILKKPLNNTESGLSDAIISVCFYLCNFRTSIVPSTA